MRVHPLVPGLLLAVPLGAACGGDEPAGPDGDAGACERARGGEVTLVAEDLAWTPSCIEVDDAGPLTIVVDNRDVGVNHNLHLTDAPGEPNTPLEPGPVRQELRVDLPDGAYELVCDIHPNMVGTIRVGDASPADP